MLDPVYSQLLLPFLLALFLAINMGGSGTAPSFSAAYGANLIPKSLIPGLFGIMVFAGAIVAGKGVALTVGKGILPAESMTITITSIVLLSVALSLLLANLLGIPQSTSQSTIFSLSGVALYFNVLQTERLFFEIIPTWFILPLLSFFITYLLGKYAYPFFVKHGKLSLHNSRATPFLQVLVIISSLYVSFAIGANNVANASGPVASMVMNELGISPDEHNFVIIMVLSTLVIAPAFGIGSSFFGHKVVHSTGKGVVQIGLLSATSISFITASLLLAVSLIRGIPASLVQLNMGAILAIGCIKTGWKGVFMRTSVHKFWVVWVVAPILAFLMSLSMTWIADRMGIL